MRYLKTILIPLLITLLMVLGPVSAQAPPELPQVPDTPLVTKWFPFTGQWMPNVDASLIGSENFKTLTNLRYNDAGLEGVSGYSKINTTALTSYTNIRSGHQLQSDRTQATYVLVHAQTDAGAGRVYQNQTDIPDQGDFEATQLHDDATGFTLGRFSDAPGGNVAYTNGVESMIWAGEEMRLAGFFTAKDSDYTSPVDYTDAVNNTLSSTGNTVTIGPTDEKITNGSMEADANWTAVNGATEAQDAAQARSGTYSWSMTTDAADEGIKSAAFTSVTGTVYEYRAWVYTTESTINVASFQGDDGTTIVEDEDIAVTASTWTLVSGEYTEVTGGALANIQFRSPTADGTGTWYVDDVSVSITGRPFILVFSTRPLQGVKFTVKTANTVKSTLVAKYWNGTAMTAVSSGSDGTATAGVALQKTGTYSFTSTETTAKPMHFQGLYLYAYEFHLSLGYAIVEYMTVDADFQPIVDVWDGILRQPIQFQESYSGVYEDYTLEVNEQSFLEAPIGAILDALDTTDHLIIMFDDRASAIKWEMLGQLVNTNASVVTISYWDGDSYESVGTVTDGTSASGKSLNQSGLMSWNPPSAALEFPQTLFGVTGYAYKITFSAQLSGTHNSVLTDAGDVLADLVTGIPAQNTVKAYKFPSLYKNRLLLCGYISGKEGNRVDYSASNAADVWNGDDSSMDGLQSLYFGNKEEPLTAGAALYNRYGSNVFEVWVALKNTKTYILTGSNAEDFAIQLISGNVGCPAPLTLATAELGYEIAKDVVRNVLIWLSATGPVIFDGGVIVPVKGIENYFDPGKSEYISTAYMSISRGWYDAANKEYNLLIPSGSGQTTNNVWLVYDMVRKKWYRKDPISAEFPQAAWPVTDSSGAKYVYAGIDTGFMMRLENGTDWDDGTATAITHIVETGDFFLSGDPWDETLIRYVMLAAKRIDEDNRLEIIYFPNTNDFTGYYRGWASTDDRGWADTADRSWAASSLASLSLSIDSGVARVSKLIESANLQAWANRLYFEVSTDSTTKGIEPLWWGVTFRKVRRSRN